MDGGTTYNLRTVQEVVCCSVADVNSVILVEAVQVEPLGGAGGNSRNWSYTANTPICNITLTYLDAISSLTFTTRTIHGDLLVSDTFGTESTNKVEVAIDTEIEFLKGIHGTIAILGDDFALTSLSFSTTKREVIGPYGHQSGYPFSLLFRDDASFFSGFYGRCGSWINSIGANLKNGESVVAGPWGAEVGDPWSYKVEGVISKIKINCSADTIYSITFTSKDKEGNLHDSKMFGKPDGDLIVEIPINTETDALNGISGTYNSTTVTSLAFSTVKKGLLGPFGTPKGTTFSQQTNGGVFDEFWGRSGSTLNAITAVVNHYTPLTIGPWGGPGGNPWTYMLEGEISTINISYRYDAITSIKFTTKDSNGVVHDSPKFGLDGSRSEEIAIGSKTITGTTDTIKNALKEITGTIGYYKGARSITSLCFYTTDGTKYGPYGTENRTTFSLPIKEGTLLGFHGRTGYWVDAIGVFLKPTRVWYMKKEDIV